VGSVSKAYGYKIRWNGALKLAFAPYLSVSTLCLCLEQRLHPVVQLSNSLYAVAFILATTSTNANPIAPQAENSTAIDKRAIIDCGGTSM
jgi:hypothetical protein